MEEEILNKYSLNEPLICNLTEIDHCMYCGKERLWFDVLDETGEENTFDEPMSIPGHEDWFWLDDFELVNNDLVKHDGGFDFCCEEHYKKWIKEKVMPFLDNESNKWNVEGD